MSPGSNALDRFVAWLDPAAGLRRAYHRARLDAAQRARAYEGASTRDGWRVRRGGASANADHQADAATLRVRARALVQNVPYARAMLDALVAHVVGTGIVPRSLDTANGPRLLALFAEWSAVCDADGRHDFQGLCKLVDRTMEQDGEVLVRLRPRRPADNLPVPLQLQVLEVDWLDATRHGAVAGTSGSVDVNGIRYDAIGRVVGYWLWDLHPGDVTLKAGMRTQSRLVPAESIIHVFDRERAGQGRGITRFAPVIARIRDLQTYEDAEAGRKNLESRFAVLASGDVASMAQPASYGEAANPSSARATGDLGPLPGGGIVEVPPGLNLTTVQPNAVPGHSDYVKLQLHIISAGFGVPYEDATGDMREANFSQARLRRLTFKRLCEQIQWLTLIPQFCTPVWRRFVEAAQLAGRVPAGASVAVDWSTPKWDYVNPSEEIKADIDEINAGLISRPEKLRQRGYDPARVNLEIADDLAALKGDVLEHLIFMQKGKLPGDAALAADAAAQQGVRALESVAGVLGRMDSRLVGLEQRRTEVTVNQGAVNVAPAEVRVEAPNVNIAPAHVTVESPEVRFEPTINVEAPYVDVGAAATAAAPGPAPTLVRKVPVRDLSGKLVEVRHEPLPQQPVVRKVVQRDAQGRIAEVRDELQLPGAEPPPAKE